MPFITASYRRFVYQSRRVEVSEEEFAEFKKNIEDNPSYGDVPESVEERVRSQLDEEEDNWGILEFYLDED